MDNDVEIDLQDAVMLGTTQTIILEQYLGNKPCRIKY
jgi:hypothetical protein